MTNDVETNKWLTSGKVAIILFVAILLVFAQSLGHGFVYDDFVLIVWPDAFKSIADFTDVFYQSHMENNLYYRPLSTVTYGLQKTMFGSEPAFFHAFNLLILFLSSLVIFYLFKCRVTNHKIEAAAWAAAIFALHPVTSSCLYPISGRESLLAVLTIGLIVWLCSTRHAGWRWLGVLLFIPGIFVRENVIIVPALVIISDALAENRSKTEAKSHLWLQYGVMVATALFYLLVRSGYTSGAPINASLSGLRLFAFSYLFALRSSLFPGLNLVYEPALALWFSWPEVVAAIALMAILVYLAIKASTQLKKQLLFWSAWSVIGFLPTANIFIQETSFDERHVLVFLVGVAGILASLIAHFRSGAHWQKFRMVLIVSLLVFATISFNRGFFYQSHEVFVKNWLATSPDSPEPLALMAGILEDEGQHDEAISYYSRALEENPQFVDCLNRRAILYIMHFRLELAAVDLEQALKIRPHSHYIRLNAIQLDLQMQKADQAITRLARGLVQGNFNQSTHWNRLVCELSLLKATSLLPGIPYGVLPPF